tara:strand:- start:402 stop:515 length:114 start_codon:yes stop_codon:yes gene_type:complete
MPKSDSKKSNGTKLIDKKKPKVSTDCGCGEKHTKKGK